MFVSIFKEFMIVYIYFYVAPLKLLDVLHSHVRNFLSNPRRIHSGLKNKEKEEYGLL